MPTVEETTAQLQRLFLSLAIVLWCFVAAFALRDPATRGRRLKLLLPAGVVLAFIGIPGRLSPLIDPVKLQLLSGGGLLLGSVWFAYSASRAHGGYSRAARSTRAEEVAGALGLLHGEHPSLDVTLRGKVSGDPPLLSPLSSRPCALFKLEVRRGRKGEPGDLIALEECAADRLVLQDASGQVGIAGALGMLCRGAPLEETVAEGEVDVSCFYGREEPVTRLARLAKRFDPDPPHAGAFVYRLVERALLGETDVTAAGKLTRQNGEAILFPLEQRLQFSKGREALVTGLRQQAYWHGALSVALGAAAFFLLLRS